MQLKFKSEINQNDNVKNIEFTVPVTVYDEEKFKVLAFDEPNTNLKSMIELSEDEINIHNSSSTIYLKYQQEHEFTFHLDHQGKLFELLWVTNWTKKEFKENYYNFTYSIKSNNSHIGEFTITLELVE